MQSHRMCMFAVLTTADWKSWNGMADIIPNLYLFSDHGGKTHTANIINNKIVKFKIYSYWKRRERFSREINSAFVNCS